MSFLATVWFKRGTSVLLELIVFVSRHVVFDEGCFPFEAGSMIANTSQSTRALPMFQHQQCAVPIMGYRSGSISLSNSATAVPTSEPSIPQSVTPYRGSQVSRSLVHLSSHSPFTSACQNSADSSSSTDPHSCLPSSSIQVPPVNPSPMQPRSNLHPMQTRSKSGIFKPKVLTTELAAVEPVTIEQAFTSKEWTLVAQQEYEALMKNHTWDLVPLPADRKAVGCKWLFKLKKNPDGTIAWYKGRLVVKGYLQEAGIDFQDTFSLVVKPMTIRVVLSLAIKLEWQLRQVDINNAFLNGELSEEIYMTQPLGFEQHSNNGLLVCRLKKALYGLKQTPRAWFSKLREFLLSSQFVCAKSDASLFVKKTDGVILYVLVYVDDIIITGNHQQSIDKFVSSLDTQFALKDLGPLGYFLGIEVTPTAEGLFLNQTKYIHDLLRKASMDHANSSPTLMIASSKLSLNDGCMIENEAEYCSIVGALQYVVITRPDITFAMNKVCQFMHRPLDQHFKAVKRILRYLQGTIDYGIQFTKKTSLDVVGYFDANWGTDIDDRQSTTGFCIFLGGNPVAWGSKKQSVVSRSTAEAEYRGLAHTVAEVVWLESLLKELYVFSL